MTSTYEKIATTTLGSAALSVTFSSISASYTDLVLIVDGSTASASGLALQFNGDTGNNYSDTYIYGDGSSAASGRNSNVSGTYIGYFGTTQSNTIAQIANYSNTTTYKSTLGRGNTAAVLTVTRVSLWRNTNAINSIKVFTEATVNFSTGSTFTLYGIKAE